MKQLKRFLILLHRWISVVFALLFVMWFASGIVMMYVEFPALTETERWAHAAPIDVDRVRIAPDEASSKIEGASDSDLISLTTVRDRAAYLYRSRGGARAIYADTGEIVSNIGPKEAERAASAFAGGANATFIGTTEIDQWSVSGSLHPYRPLHKVRVDDGRGGLHYVSARTGQVVRDTNGWERRWNWVGSTLHWIYPRILRQHPGVWAEVVIWLSVGGVIVTVTGVVVGIWRMRLTQRYKSGSISPYRAWHYWHHIGGLTCALFVLTFMFSGLMSMSPWGLFDNKGESAGIQIARITGGATDLSDIGSISVLASALPATFSVREVQFNQHLGKPYAIFIDPNGQRIPVSSGDSGEALLIGNMALRMQELAPRLLPDSRVMDLNLLEEFDDYYYSTHQRYRPLPMIRVRFDDEAKTWYHLDPVTGEVQSRMTGTDRVKRWLYNGLHSLDFRFLMANRPLWDIVVIFLSLLGTAFCCTGVVIGWRRLKAKVSTLKRKRKHPPHASAVS